MSIRAFRITKLAYQASPSWNLWNDEALCDFLEDTWFNFTTENGGIIHVPVKTLEQAVEDGERLKLRAETVAALEADIAAARRAQDDCVTYYCG